jgi:protein-S-isoprenylcysteine O-methyltransferase Ste14
MGIFWIILAIAVWGVLHSLFASLPFKDFVRRRLGPSADRGYRLVYNVIAGVTFLPVLAAAAATPDHLLYSVPFPWSLLMVFGQFLAFAMLVVGFFQSRPMEFLGLRQLAGPIEEPAGLTTGGLYHYVRHPLYTAGLVFLWLASTMTVDSLAITIALTLYIVIGAFFEERRLRREFGQAYADYAALTPMFIPFLKGNKPPRSTSG